MKSVRVKSVRPRLPVTAAAISDIGAKDAEKHLASMEGGRRLAEEALRESEERYRLLLDGIEDYAIFMMDPRGNVVSWNAGAERIKGYRADQIIGRSFSCFFPAEDIERGRPEDVLRLTAANGRHEEQGLRVRKDGSRFLASLTFTALRDPAGNLRGFSEFSHDLSESKESGAKYRGLLEAAPDAMVVVNQDGEIVLVNLRAEKQFGYRRDELLGQRVTNIIPKGFAKRLHSDGLRSAENALAQQIGTGIELIGRRKDGSEFPIELMLSPLKNAEGILVTAAIRDISERKYAEEALRAGEEQFRLLTNGVKDYAIFMLDTAGRIVTWNAGAERIKGYRAEEILNRHFSAFYPREDIESGKPAKVLERAAVDGRVEDEGWRIRKDGSRFWANVVISALRDESGNLRGFAKVSRDDTARKDAEDALSASEERLRLTIEAAEMGTWFWDIQTDEVSCSEKFRALCGLTSNDKLDYQACVAMAHPDDKERIHQAVKETLELGVPFRVEYRVIWPDSSVHWLTGKGRAHHNSDGVAVHMQGIVVDITARKQAQEALKDQEALERRATELTRSNEDLQQFAYIAAHDLQEPLRMVASYTQLLSRRYTGKLDSDADEFIAYAVDGAHRMQLLIEDLLAYCRVGTSGKAPQEISSTTALEQALLNLRGAIEESGGVVTHDPLPNVIVDGAQLVQLFQNVVGNALKYRSAEPPRVHVSAKKNHAGEWIFSMQDNGLGIDPQYFKKIFVMFQRLHGREEFSGTGIGLTLCKKIAERHGGRMWVESNPGKGSTFYLALPERG